MSTDWNKVRDSLQGSLASQLAALIDGTAKDLDGPVREAANRLTLSLQSGDKELIDETRDQLALYLVQNELRLKGNLSNSLGIVLGVGINFLVDGALAGLGAVRS